MIRSQLIKAIYFSDDMWSCPNCPCDLPEEEGNTGECCWKCAEKQLAEYEAAVIESFAHSLKETFNNEFPTNYHSARPFFTLENVRILIDTQMKIEEQKDDSKRN